MSQPSRALFIFFKINKIPAEFINVDLQGGEHLSDEYQKINRFQKVPCIVTDDGFKLSESIAIFRYLMETNSTIQSHWYPKDPKARARVDEYLEWQHNNTRLGCAISFQIRKNIPPFSFQNSDGEKPALQIFELLMEISLENIEKNWLGDKKFIAGNEISFADLLAVCEIEQSRAAGYSPYDGRLKLKEWHERIRTALNPFYDEANVIVEKMVKRVKAKL